MRKPCLAPGLGRGKPFLSLLGGAVWGGGLTGVLDGDIGGAVRRGLWGLPEGGCIVKGAWRRWQAAARGDLVLSWREARGGIIIGAVLFFAASLRCQAGAGGGERLTLSAYFCDVFAGSLPFAQSGGAPFTLPAAWFALVFFCVHSCALFPARLLRGMGTARLMRARSRLRWWWRMMSLSVFWSVVYLVLGVACMAAAGFVCTGALPKADIQAGQFWLVFLTLCVLSSMQAACSALLSPFAGQAALILLLVCSAFWDSPLLWPRYAMLRRGTSEQGGFPAVFAAAYLIVSFLAVFVLGARLFQKRDIVSPRS